LTFDDDDLARRPRQSSGSREANNAGSDDKAID
jgi:hypothetical protein